MGASFPLDLVAWCADAVGRPAGPLTAWWPSGVRMVQRVPIPGGSREMRFDPQGRLLMRKDSLDGRRVLTYYRAGGGKASEWTYDSFLPVEFVSWYPDSAVRERARLRPRGAGHAWTGTWTSFREDGRAAEEGTYYFVTFGWRRFDDPRARLGTWTSWDEHGVAKHETYPCPPGISVCR